MGITTLSRFKKSRSTERLYRITIMIFECNISPKQFQDEFFGKNFLFLEKSFRNFRFTWSDVDDLLNSANGSPTKFRIIYNQADDYASLWDGGKNTAPNLAGALNHDRFYRMIRDGATVVLNHIDETSRLVRGYCSFISHLANCPTSCNAYFSRGGSSSLGQHWDTHDVVAVQLLGRKRWRVFRPTFPHPLRKHKTNVLAHTCPVDPVFETTLYPGDVLYVPKGWWHSADPLENEDTVHLAVGVHSPTVLEYFEWILSQLADEDIALRRPFHMESKSAQNAAYTKEAAQQLIVALDNPLLMRSYLNQFKIKTTPSIPFRIKQNTENLNPLEPSWKVSFAGFASHDPPSNQIFVAGKKIELDDESAILMNFIRDRGEVTVSELTKLVSSQKTSILNRLLFNLEARGIIHLTPSMEAI